MDNFWSIPHFTIISAYNICLLSPYLLVIGLVILAWMDHVGRKRKK